MWLEHFVNRCRAQGKPVEPWLYGIYCGQAKRLAINPPSPEWGRSMAAKRGGYARQMQCRLDGKNPTLKATYVRLMRQGRPESGKRFLEASRRVLPQVDAPPVSRSQRQSPPRKIEPVVATVGGGEPMPRVLVDAVPLPLRPNWRP